MDTLLLQDLAASPPQDWEKIRKRAQVVHRFLSLNTTDPAEIARHAATLGVGTRMFYNLVRIFKERRAGAGARCDRRGGYKLRREMSDAIDDAIASLAPDAIEADARVAAAAECRRRGLPGPSFNAVWARFGRPRTGVNMRGRLGITADAVVDSCYLAIDVLADGAAAPANLIGLLDTTTGLIVRHTLVAGEPSLAQALDVLGEDGDRPGRVVATPALAAVLTDVETGSSPNVRTADSKGRRLTTGSALRAALGLRLGRVTLHPRRATAGGDGLPPPMALPFVREIVGALVQERNLALKRA